MTGKAYDKCQISGKCFGKIFASILRFVLFLGPRTVDPKMGSIPIAHCFLAKSMHEAQSFALKKKGRARVEPANNTQNKFKRIIKRKKKQKISPYRLKPGISCSVGKKKKLLRGN